MSELVSNSIQVFNYHFLDDIKDLCTNNKKIHPVVHTYNDEKKITYGCIHQKY